eukprot:TRINITY_DN6808_c0_g1_i3.p1 TRINITY_DN6808_c0_g1~~TRINITY_DN6808_c0_g1_i3.p1  ORF type:complete len:479 (-),score=71.45 TRINITY_DN6808_c0_g1_i3:85-1521(-)
MHKANFLSPRKLTNVRGKIVYVEEDLPKDIHPEKHRKKRSRGRTTPATAPKSGDVTISDGGLNMHMYEAWLPFYIFSGTFDVETKVSMKTRYLSMGKVKYQFHTFYDSFEFSVDPQKRREESRLGYVFGSYDFRRPYAKKLFVTGPNLNTARPLREQLRAYDADGDLENLPPDVHSFTVSPAIAKDFAMESFYEAAKRLGKKRAEKYSHGDVLSVSLTMSAPKLRHDCYYLPAFVVHYEYRGEFFRTLISGVTGRAGGEVHYNGTKVGVAAMVGQAVSLVVCDQLISGTVYASLFALSNPVTWAFFSAVSVGAGLFARAWPGLSAKWKENERKKHKKSDEWDGEMGTNERVWSESRTRNETEWRYKEFNQEDMWRQQEKQDKYERRHTRRQHAGSADTDIKGLYAALGVDRSNRATATQTEIKRSYRRMCLKWHPDVHQGKDAKARASKKFKELQHAYTILKDPAKREIYDRQGIDRE